MKAVTSRRLLTIVSYLIALYIYHVLEWHTEKRGFNHTDRDERACLSGLVHTFLNTVNVHDLALHVREHWTLAKSVGHFGKQHEMTSAERW